MTLCFGSFATLVVGGKRLLWQEPISLHDLLEIEVRLLAAFFLWFNIVTGFFWNRRARRLQAKQL